MGNRRKYGFVLGPLLFAALLLMPLPEGMSGDARAVAAVTALMAAWWISESIPIAATALIPIVLFPLLGVMSTAQTTASYANHLIYLFLGGFLIAMAMQKWQLHKRIALHTIRIVGTSPTRNVLGFMLATAFLSMWISNTATAMMMLPIGLAVISTHMEGRTEENGFSQALMLGIAYSASIGGVATLIGTPPNAILAGVLEEQFDIVIGFADWLIFAFPLSAVMLLFAWLYLTRVAYALHRDKSNRGMRELIHQQLHELGPMNRQETAVLLVFLLVAAGWILRGLLDLPWLQGVSDATIAMAGAVSLFLIPSDWRKGEFLLDWKSAVQLPWEVIILFGGGFTLASGFAGSGLTAWLVNQLGGLQAVPGWMLVAAVTLLVIFLTEVTSNTATATIVLPVMGALAGAMEVAPTLLMIPAAIAASYAFMLPVATPPNAIVFSGGHLSIPQMARAGLWMNLLAALVISLFVFVSSPV